LKEVKERHLLRVLELKKSSDDLLLTDLSQVLSSFKSLIEMALPGIYINEDSLLWMEIASEYPVYQSEKETCVYLTHENNSINVQKNNVFKNRLDSINIALGNPNIKKNISREKQQLAKSDCYFGMFKYYKYNQKKKQQILCMLSAIILYPSIKLKNKIHLLLSSLPIFSNFIKE
jgi:hypothetical protein